MEKVQHTAGAGASDRITADEVDLMFKVWGPSHRPHARVPCLPCRATDLFCAVAAAPPAVAGPGAGVKRWLFRAATPAISDKGDPAC